MASVFLIILLQLLIGRSAVAEAIADSECKARWTSHRTVNLQVNSRQDENGEWITKFHAWKSDDRTNDINLNVTHAVYECDDGQAVHIKGVISGIRMNETARNSYRLVFHPKCGTNAAIGDDGRSVQKINLDDPLNGVVLTNRPLRRNELFEVRMDKKHTKHPYALGIGITTYSPESFNIPHHMYSLKSGNWMMYHPHVYIDGEEKVKHYGKNFDDLQVGDRIGVMVNNFGTLHFFVNGVDQGPAVSNIPLKVHGVFELYHNAAKGTIVSP